MEYAYDQASRMTNIAHRISGTNFASFGYAYNSVGNRTSRAETSGGATVTDAYSYDSTDQVVGVNYNSGARTVGYQWDAVGNRVAVTNNGTATSYTANNLNQYTAVGADSPTYDNRGNLVTQSGWTYTFDAQNRLLTATNNTTVASFSYDARNRCVSRTVNGVTTLLIYDQWNLIEEWTTGGAQIAHYVHGPRMDEILVKVSTTNAVYYHHHALGNTTYLTGTNGAVVEKYTYDIFGAVTMKDGSGNTIGATAYANRFLFTGREWLAEISLYDYRNRVYSPDLGRFLQTDPIRLEAGDVNIFRYCGNDAINTVDPLGLAGGNGPGGGGVFRPYRPFGGPTEDLPPGGWVGPRFGPWGPPYSPHFEPGHFHFPHHPTSPEHPWGLCLVHGTNCPGHLYNPNPPPIPFNPSYTWPPTYYPVIPPVSGPSRGHFFYPITMSSGPPYTGGQRNIPANIGP